MPNEGLASSKGESLPKDEPKRPLTFGLNGKVINIPAADVDPTVMLVEYIRTQLKGTKMACAEGGCGACTVVLSRCDTSGNIRHVSVPACLLLLPQVDGCAITTTEGLKNSDFHPIQERIAELSGLQCGFCTPGFVMAIYGALHSGQAVRHGGLTMQEMEASLDGNICRCTGYRPILDTAKSFAKDQNVDSKYGPYDPTKDPTFPEPLRGHSLHGSLDFSKNGVSWVRPDSLKSLFKLLPSIPQNHRVKFVGGNTGRAFERVRTHVYIDVSNLAELRGVRQESSGGISVGGATSIADFIDILVSAASKKENVFLAPLKYLACRIAGTHVRNVGSIAGNLVLAKTIGFQSDLATGLLGASALLRLVSPNGRKEVSIAEYLSSPEVAWGELIEAVVIPGSKEGDVFNTFKASIRNQNAHCYVNAALKFNIGGGIINNATLAFGGVEYGVPGAHALRATATEALLQGKALSAELLREACRVLKQEMVPTGHRQEYRHRLVLGFFYKFFLGASHSHSQGVHKEARLESAYANPTPVATTSAREFRVNPEHAPVGEPIPEVSGRVKAAGEAVFSGDVADVPGTLYAAHVVSPIAKGKVTVDFSPCLAKPGVWRVLGPQDVKVNNCNTWGPDIEHIFTDSPVFHSQSLGLVLADTWQHALGGANAAIIRPQEEVGAEAAILNLEQAKAQFAQQLKSNPNPEVLLAKQPCKMGEGALKNKQDLHHLCGHITQASQHHFYLETQTSYVVPEENGKLSVYCSNQYPGNVAQAISGALGIKHSDINVLNRRCGGGFGGKLAHHVRHACAAAVAAVVCKRPVKLVLPRSVDTAQSGGREEVNTSYEVSFNERGRVSCVKADSYLMSGFNNALSWFANSVVAQAANQCYEFANYEHTSYLLKANLASRTVMRAPGDVQANYIAETIIDHVAQTLGLTTEEVRERNFYSFDPSVDEATMKLPAGNHITHWTMPRIWPLCKEKSGFEAKRAAARAFNQANRWRKRGVAMTPVRYQVMVFTRQAVVNIYADGSVLVTSDGSEMGQGLYTKVTQAAAHALGKLVGESLPLNSISIGDMSTNATPNPGFTGGSTGSEGACEAVSKASAELVSRLQSVADNLTAINGAPPSWKEVCAAAAEGNVHLSAVAQVRGAGDDALVYQNFGAGCSEIELDVITGEVSVRSVELVYDCGRSLNPIIDIGQAEGAFVMGLGFYLTEEVRISEKGAVVSTNTWEYKPPGVADIPRHFSLTFLHDSNFEKGFLSSKCSGEPPLCLATSTVMAVKDAVYAARADLGLSGFVALPVPATPADIALLCAHDESNFTL